MIMRENGKLEMCVAEGRKGESGSILLTFPAINFHFGIFAFKSLRQRFYADSKQE